jgi:hypothetical protein
MESMLHGVSPEMTNQIGLISRHCNKGELDEHWAAEHTKQEDHRHRDRQGHLDSSCRNL